MRVGEIRPNVSMRVYSKSISDRVLCCGSGWVFVGSVNKEKERWEDQALEKREATRLIACEAVNQMAVVIQEAKCRRDFREGMINLVSVAKMLSEKTPNFPFGRVKAADPHKIIPREWRGEGLILVGSNEEREGRVGREGSGDTVNINSFF